MLIVLFYVKLHFLSSFNSNQGSEKKLEFQPQPLVLKFCLLWASLSLLICCPLASKNEFKLLAQKENLLVSKDQTALFQALTGTNFKLTRTTLHDQYILKHSANYILLNS